MPVKKTKTKSNDIFGMRLDPATRNKLDSLAERSERTASAVVRWLIKREYDRLDQEPPSGNGSNAQPHQS